ncbi:MAG: protein-L-isoaspartate(D-aspartate) O-methyltransferase [Cytophagales bacterium]|nr:protein-L-isoaspartate(D-aspartate) O-methyltransferase [Bernardetiaceae bacterium]MDW8205581.1 protein-L-isoaspartate(D-aspartate) O-methyltransferase [Cytophagales bacterium]
MQDTFKHIGLRMALVEQLRKKGIQDERVLAAIGAIPRHFFLDSAFAEHAYQDKAFAIGEGQTISQPYTVAFQTQLLQLKPGEKVLEVGTGSGYQAAILCYLGAKVFSVECKRKLFLQAKKTLAHLHIKPTLIFGDGSVGLPSQAPFHAILVTAAAPAVPQALTEQLDEGGRLVIPVGDLEKQTMLRITKKEGHLICETFDTFAFVPLTGKFGWQ